MEVRVYDRARLRPGDLIQGPAIVEEPDSTTVCPPRYAVSVDGYSTCISTNNSVVRRLNAARKIRLV